MAREETRGGKDLNYHYNREERLAMGDHAKEPEPKGLFRRNRSLAIILLDVVLILIMFVLLQFVFIPGRSWTRVEDYRLELKTFRFEDQVYASVEIQRIRENNALTDGSDTLITIGFGGRENMLDVLPSDVGDSIIVSAVLPASEIEADEPVIVDLELLGREVTLRSTPE